MDLHHYFASLGLSPILADLYQALHTHGAQTISELSRNAKVERTQIYRLLDELKASGLIEVEVHYKRNIIRPAPVANLQVLIAKKEQELKDVKTFYPKIAADFSQQKLGVNPARVQFYEGIEGIKQMIWGQTKTKGENLSILHSNMQNQTNQAFFERWAIKCNEANIHFRSLVNGAFLETQRSWYQDHRNEKLEHWQGRYISNEHFPITYSIVVYNDIVLHYNWSEGATFGIEIHSADIAATQRQFFELLWQQAAPLTKQTR